MSTDKQEPKPCGMPDNVDLFAAIRSLIYQVKPICRGIYDGGGYTINFLELNRAIDNIEYAMAKRSDLCTRANTAVVEWRTIDSAPKDQTQVIVYKYAADNFDHLYCVAYYLDGKWLSADDDVQFHNPSHWLPLDVLPMPPSLKIIAENTEKEGG